MRGWLYFQQLSLKAQHESLRKEEKDFVVHISYSKAS